ncbi:putative transposase [Trichonephila clavipes]|nr:putative transposase [Trichonephila clavipes]
MGNAIQLKGPPVSLVSDWCRDVDPLHHLPGYLMDENASPFLLGVPLTGIYLEDDTQRCVKLRTHDFVTHTIVRLVRYLSHCSCEAISVNRFLAGKNTPVVPQPLFSPDLSPSDFFLFPKLKNHLKGHHFGTLENIQTAVTDQLKAISISEFHPGYEEWKKRLQRRLASEGSYFEETLLNCKFIGINK